MPQKPAIFMVLAAKSAQKRRRPGEPGRLLRLFYR
jgi:hypothetical protein